MNVSVVIETANTAYKVELHMVENATSTVTDAATLLDKAVVQVKAAMKS